jgi:hypothetical protein
MLSNFIGIYPVVAIPVFLVTVFTIISDKLFNLSKYISALLTLYKKVFNMVSLHISKADN